MTRLWTRTITCYTSRPQIMLRRLYYGHPKSYRHACWKCYEQTNNLMYNWCRLVHYLSKRRQLSTSACNQEDIRVKPLEWSSPMILSPPEFDWEYLCHPDNMQEIEENIKNRKGVGDIHAVIDIWKKLQNEKKPAVRQQLQENLLKAAAEIPNKSHPLSPIGEESCAELVDTVGQKRNFNFKPKSVVELGEKLDVLRSQNLAATTGPRTYYFKDALARLEQALIKYTLDTLIKKGFQLISVPDLLYPEIIEGCGFRTTGEVTQVYKLERDNAVLPCLAGTAEIPLAGYFKNSTLDHEDLPTRLTAVSRCYRAEVSDRKDERGIYRVHQFTKVEMFSVVSGDEEATCMLEDFVSLEKDLFTRLGLHFRILNMPTQELGAPAYKKYDIEAWMPNKRLWGEISSASNCTDYQSRRLNIKYRDSNDTVRHCYTVNGTACAVPRMVMTIFENNQEKDGSVCIPEVLWEYMNGQKKLTKPETEKMIKRIPLTRKK